MKRTDPGAAPRVFAMQRIQIPFADQLLALELPAGTEVLIMAEVQTLPDPAAPIMKFREIIKLAVAHE